MTNAERRIALTKARRKALEYALAADLTSSGHDKDRYVQMANMWANVAEAMKVGSSPEADGATP